MYILHLFKVRAGPLSCAQCHSGIILYSYNEGLSELPQAWEYEIQTITLYKFQRKQF